jgi:hypothetical protein
MEVYYRGERLAFTELPEPIRKTARRTPPAARPVMVRKAKQDHPWRQSYQNMRPRVPNRAMATPPRVGTHFRFALNYRASLQRVFQRETPQHKKGTLLIS